MRISRLIANWLVTTLSLIFAVNTVADHHKDWGPETGAAIPPGLSVTSQKGETLSVRELAAGNGVVIAFVRSADWCPFCKRQIIELNNSRESFAERGIKLVALSYDSVEVLKEFSEQHDIGITLLSDPTSSVIDAFGIRNEEHEEGSTGYGIPHPGIMVFDGDGKLVAKFAEQGYRKRPAVDKVLVAIDAHM